MPGTMLPLITLPEEEFVRFPFALSLEGQYIVKNLVLIAAGIVLGGQLRRRVPSRSSSRRISVDLASRARNSNESASGRERKLASGQWQPVDRY